MQKEFIPYEQALDLEGIDFDIRPDFGNQTSLYTKDGRHLFYTNYGVMGSGIDEGYIYAPTFSQAFRWFREKCKIISTIHFYCDGDKWEDVVYEVRISEFEHFKTHDSFVQSEFKTYEEAELACLKKLIDIVKEKKD